jgi:hypothetical protein
MEVLLILASVCLVLFMILATFDGFYLHFSAIILVFARKIDLVNGKLVFVNSVLASFTKEVFVSLNLIPGAVLLALLHLMLWVEQLRVWNSYRSKISCC